jgi:hypothetical protein
MRSMTDLIGWLLEQIDADFELAGGGADGRRITRAVHVNLTCYTDDVLFAARWSPAHVLAECEAKRRIISGFIQDFQPTKYGQGRVDEQRRVLRLLALPYADRPGYREEWRP